MPLRLPSTLAACARWVLGLWLCVALASAFAPLARASGWERLCSAAGESVWVPSPAGQDNADRKSTRLNSSHLVISYAVFCLKKKNTITPSYMYIQWLFQTL